MPNQFGNRLKKLREERELSLEQLATLLGTSKQVLSRYETGQRMPKVDTVVEYAARLQVSIEWLTGYEAIPSLTEALTKRELQFIECFREVPPETQDFIIAFLFEHRKKQQQKQKRD